MSRPLVPDPAAISLWRDRNFNTFWSAQAFDFTGDSVALILMPLLVLAATRSVAQMGLVTACISVGTAIAGVFCGNLIDRVDRRNLLIACDLGRVAAYSVIPLSLALGVLTIGVIYAVALVAGVMTGCFLITYSTVTPRLVTSGQIAHANGRLQATIALTYVGGPTVAGVGAQFLGPARFMLLVVLCYAASALVMTRVRMATRQWTARTGTSWIRSGFLDGVRFIWGQPTLRAVTVLFASFTLASQAAVDLFIFYLSHDLRQNRLVVGLAFGIGALGAVLGGALTPVLRRHVGFGMAFVLALFVQSLAMIAVGLQPGLAVGVLLITGFSLGYTLRNASTMSMRQQLTPDAVLGRTTAAFWTLAALLSPLATALATRSAQRAGVPLVLTCMGFAGLMISAAGWFSAARRVPVSIARLQPQMTETATGL
jgi:MFS family permease